MGKSHDTCAKGLRPGEHHALYLHAGDRGQLPVQALRERHDNIPFLNLAYDGQEPDPHPDAPGGPLCTRCASSRPGKDKSFLVSQVVLGNEKCRARLTRQVRCALRHL